GVHQIDADEGDAVNHHRRRCRVVADALPRSPEVVAPAGQLDAPRRRQPGACRADLHFALTRRQTSANTSTDAVLAMITSQSIGPRGSTLNTAASHGMLVSRICTTAVVPAIIRNVGLPSKLDRPLTFGSRERALIWFHTWKNTYTAKKM